MPRLDQIAALEKRFLLPTYNRYPVGFERGKGVFLYDFEGKKYLDFVAGLGVNALGHAHPRIVKTIREQAARVIHLSNLYYNEYQGQLAERLCQLSGSVFDRVFFSNSGTEAIDGALKRLPAHRRLPLVLYHFEEMSYEEIALRLRVSLAKVKTDIRRARAALLPMLRSQGVS